MNKSLQLLCDGFKDEVAEFLYCDERFSDVLHEIVLDFVQENIPLVDENYQCELAMMLMDKIIITIRS
jgi:hypothetical protein